MRIEYCVVLCIALVFSCTLLYGCKKNPNVEANQRDLTNEREVLMKATPEFYFDGCISCSLSIAEDGESAEELFVIVTLRNETGYPIPVEKRHLFMTKTGSSGVMEWGVFQVNLGEEEVPYHGVTLLRDGPKYPDDYCILPSHGQYVAKVNIAEYYNISKRGKYSMQYLAFNAIVIPEKANFSFKIESNVANFKVD